MVASGVAGHPRPTSQYSSLISSWLPLARHLLSKPQFPLLEKDSQCEHLTLQVSEGHLVSTHPQNVSGGSLSKCSSNFSLQGASFGLCDELHSRDFPYYFTGEETTALESKKLVEVTKQRDTSPRGV